MDGGAMLEFEKNIGQMLQNSGTSDDEDLEHIQSILEEATEGEISSQITVERNERGTVIRFMNNVLFDAGEAVIRKEAESVMEEVGNLLHSEQFRGHPVAVEGHTDTDPVKYVNKYPTNWELSSARATGVVRFLIEKSGIEPQRLSASGYSFYHPVAPNDTAENKAMNRRVDIVLLNSDVNETPAKTEENNTPEVQSGEGTPDTESTPKVQP